MLTLGTLACFVAGAAQQKGLRYHFYPSFALAAVLLGVVAADLRAPIRTWVRRVYRVVAVSTLTTLALVVLAQNAIQATGAGHDPERDRLAELISLVHRRAAGEPVFVMSYHIGSGYPLINYSGVRSASRFGHLWLLASSYAQELKSDQPLRYRGPTEMGPSERYLNQAVRSDLAASRPRLLIVLRSARDLPANGYRRLNYVAYFRRDPVIAGMLDRYRWVANSGEYAVYERLTDGVATSASPPSAAPGTQDVLSADTEGLHLRVHDPSFLMAVACFVVTLGLVGAREIRWTR